MTKYFITIVPDVKIAEKYKEISVTFSVGGE